MFTCQLKHAVMYKWRVDPTENTFRYDRIEEPLGPNDHRGQRDTPFRTTTTLNLQPILTLMYRVDEIQDSRGDVDTGKQAARDATRLQRQTDSPISHHNS